MEEELLSAIRSGNANSVEKVLNTRYYLSMIVLKECRKALTAGLFLCVEEHRANFINVLSDMVGIRRYTVVQSAPVNYVNSSGNSTNPFNPTISSGHTLYQKRP